MATKAEIAKLEKQKKLHYLFLDLSYAIGGYDNRISDLNMELREAKKEKKAAEKALKKTAKLYEEVYGEAPTPPRGL